MMEKRRPLVAEIKRNSLDDGPGIRSVVFFKGCPLRCAWCHNPECISAAPEIMFRRDVCIGCGTCRESCPEGAIGERGPAKIDRDRCTLCGECIDECPSGAVSLVGKYYEPGELVEALLRDKLFYDNSGGGVTLSGGEPTLVLDYTSEVARRLRAAGVQVLLETCGDFDWDRFAEKLLPHVDLVYADLKLAAEESHKQWTGRGNSRIKRNLERLLRQNPLEVLIRVPLVPEVTATLENLAAISAWLREHGQRRLALLPYNPLWLSKARGLGGSLAYERGTWMSEEERKLVLDTFSDFQIEREI